LCCQEKDYTTNRTSKYTYTYNKLGRLTGVGYPEGDSLKGVKFTYGKYGRIDGIDAATGDGNIPVRRYTYDKWGRVKTMSDYLEKGGGAECLVKSYAYDIFGRTVAMTMATDTAPGEELERHSYTYDKKSQVTSERVTIAGADVDLLKEYAYDRLVSTEISAHVPSDENMDEVTKDYIANLHLGTPTGRKGTVHPSCNLAHKGLPCSWTAQRNSYFVLSGEGLSVSRGDI
jgi:YD repeat-containing protein